MRDLGELPETSNHNLRMIAPDVTTPRQSKAAKDMAATIQGMQANLGLILERLGEATRRGLDDAQGPSGGGGEPVGGTKDYTEQMLSAIERDDDARKALTMLVASLGAAANWIERGWFETSRLLPLPKEKAKFLLGQGPSYCKNVNCGREVWGTPRDRIISGRCEACDQYRRRHEGAERPESLCHPQQEKQRVDPKVVNLTTRAT